MKGIKRIAAATMAALMLTGIVPATALAAETADTDLNVTELDAEQEEWNEPELLDTEVKWVGFTEELKHEITVDNSVVLSDGTESDSTEGTDSIDELDLLLKYTDEIRTALLAGTSSIDLTDLNMSIENEQFKHLGYYCPYFDGTNITGTFYKYSDDTYASMLITNTLSADETKAWVARIDEKINELLELISDPALSEADQALILHDYMASHYFYDTASNSHKYYTYYPSNLLTQNFAVCQAYAYLFQYVMNKKGYECYQAVSKDMNHSWNILKIGDYYYQIDITWDDPTNDRYGEAQHKFFLVSDTTLQDTTHKHYNWDLTNYACTDTSYEDDYFVSATSPVIVEGDDRYYVDAGGLKDYNVTSGQTTLLQNLGYWYVWGSETSLYSGKYSGLFEFDGQLYYNTASAVKAYNLYTGLESTVADIDTENGYVYGVICEDDTISYEYAQIYRVDYQSKDIRTLELPAAHNHTYDEGTVTKEATSSETGSITYTCTFCGTTYSETIPKLASAPDMMITAEKSKGSTGTTYSKIKATGSIMDFASLTEDDLSNVTEHGIIYIAASRLGSGTLTVDTKGRTKVKFSAYSESGTFSYTFRPASAATKYAIVTYIVYNGTYYYSDPITVSLNSLQ